MNKEQRIIPEELMIGNWVEYHSHMIPVTSIGKFGISSETEERTAHVKFTNMHLHPIPLSPSILEAAGFEVVNHIHGGSNYIVCGKGMPSNGIFVILKDGMVSLGQGGHFSPFFGEYKYLHQLQNLTKALGCPLSIDLTKVKDNV